MIDTPLFVKTHDWNLWLVLANGARGRERREHLEIADTLLVRLLSFLRYAVAWLKGTDR